MHYKTNKNQRGASLVEFAIVATVFLTVLFGILEFGRLLWTHNALTDATRRGVRYATIRKNDAAGNLAVQKMVVYGDPNANPATATPVVPGLAISNVVTTPNDCDGVLFTRRATVSITSYQFQFAVPFFGGTVSMPSYRRSLPCESAGYVPCDIPSATPSAPCGPIPN